MKGLSFAMYGEEERAKKRTRLDQVSQYTTIIFLQWGMRVKIDMQSVTPVVAFCLRLDNLGPKAKTYRITEQ